MSNINPDIAEYVDLSGREPDKYLYFTEEEFPFLWQFLNENPLVFAEFSRFMAQYLKKILTDNGLSTEKMSNLEELSI